MKCLLDMDGVLVDFVRGAIELHDLPANLYDDPKSLGDFDIVKLSGLKPQDFWKDMGFDFWASLPWTADGMNILNLVLSKFGDKNICLLTSPCMTEGCIEGKLYWIRRNLPDFSRRFLVGPAKEFCAGPNNYLIDDSDHNRRTFEAHGGNCILVPRPWNSMHHQRHRTLDHLMNLMGDH